MKLNSCKKENKSELQKKKKRVKSVLCNGIVKKYVYPCTTKGSLVDNEVVPEKLAQKNSRISKKKKKNLKRMRSNYSKE